MIDPPKHVSPCAPPSFPPLIPLLSLPSALCLHLQPVGCISISPNLRAPFLLWHSPVPAPADSFQLYPSASPPLLFSSRPRPHLSRTHLLIYSNSRRLMFPARYLPAREPLGADPSWKCPSQSDWEILHRHHPCHNLKCRPGARIVTCQLSARARL